MDFKDKLSDIKVVICLADGVLTSGEYFIVPGREFDFIRGVHKRDALAMSMYTSAGFDFVIVTGDNSDFLTYKTQYLGVKKVITGSKNKLKDVQEYCTFNKVELSEVLYIGDDLPDYKVMNEVGVAVCPSTAVPAIKDIADYVTKAPGGKGCVREIIEIIAEERNVNLLDYI